MAISTWKALNTFFQRLSVSGIALEVAHPGHVLETGVIVQTGTAKELLASEEVQKAYLGM